MIHMLSGPGKNEKQREGAQLGGYARARTLSQERLSEIARNAGRTNWAGLTPAERREKWRRERPNGNGVHLRSRWAAMTPEQRRAEWWRTHPNGGSTRKRGPRAPETREALRKAALARWAELTPAQRSESARKGLATRIERSQKAEGTAA